MRPPRLLPVLLALVLSATLLAQEDHARSHQSQAQPGSPASVAPALPDHWLQGYAKTVSGDWILYPWAYPGQTATLLSRATDGGMAVEWDGEPVPAGAPDDMPQQPIETWTRVRPEDAVFADGQHVMRVGFSHVGPAQPARVLADGLVLWSGTAEPGYTTVLVPAGANAAVSVPVVVTLGSTVTFSGRVAFEIVPPRSIHLLPHSHIDIGYSDPQPEVERKQWMNLRDAVELGRKTAAYPSDARFRWNVEGLWAVEGYLTQATPGERAAFAAAVRAGTIGLQANYTNILTGLATPGELQRWTDAARRVRAALGAGPIRSAMHSDIPGVNTPGAPPTASASPIEPMS